MANENFETDEALTAKLAAVLETWPLYRALAYTGAVTVKVLPENLSLHCENCKKERYWETDVSSYSDHKVGFANRQYTCRNCGESRVTYYFYWGKSNSVTLLFFKVGQWPELEETVPETLKNALSAEDLKTYRNALRLRNFNLGIGAVAYVRRVVENRMNDMLDVLHEAARAHNMPAELLAKHEGIKKDKRFSVKVDYAGDLLPANLRPSGHPNPIAVLHELTSEGLHSKSDEQCVDIFDECRQTFEYVFGKMRIEAEEAVAFVKGIAKLSEKRAKAVSDPKPAGKTSSS